MVRECSELKCNKSIARHGDYVECSANSEHVFHVECAPLSVEEWMNGRQDGSLKRWLCGQCRPNEREVYGVNMHPNYEQVINDFLNSNDFKKIVQKSSAAVISATNAAVSELKSQITELRNENKILYEKLDMFLQQQEDITQKYLLEKHEKENVTKEKISGTVNKQTPKQQQPTYVETVRNNPIQNKEKGKNKQNVSSNGSQQGQENSSRQTRELGGSRVSEVATGQVHGGQVQEHAATENDAQFTVVGRKRRNKNIIRGSKSGCKLLGAERRAWLFIGRIKGKETSERELLEYLEEEGLQQQISCKKLNSTEWYSNFKIGIPFDMLEKINKAEYWPENVIVRRFNFNKSEQQKKLTSQPFLVNATAASR